MSQNDNDQSTEYIECKYCSTNIFEKKELESKVKSIYIIVVSAIILIAGLYFNFFTERETSWRNIVHCSGHNFRI